MRKALILSAAMLLAPAICVGACGKADSDPPAPAGTDPAPGGMPAETGETPAAAGDPTDPTVQPESLLPDPQNTQVADLPRSIVVDNDLIKADIKFDEGVFSFAPAIAMDVVEDARIRLDAMTEDATEYKKADPEYFRPYGLKIDWIVSGASGSLASLEGFQYTYTGGAHGNFMTDGRIYNAMTGDQIQLADLFIHPEDAVAGFLDKVYVAIAKEKTARSGDAGSYETFLGEAKDAVSASDILNGQISLVGSTEDGKLGGFVLHFAPYEIGAYAEGAYHIAVPQADFHDYLKPDYAGLFAGEPAKLKRPDQ